MHGGRGAGNSKVRRSKGREWVVKEDEGRLC